MSKTKVRKSQQTKEFPNSTKEKDETTQLFESYRVGGPYWKKTTRGFEFGPTRPENQGTQMDCSVRHSQAELCFTCDSF